jgi:nucleoside-diphosphate-sugar epimerase
LRGKVCSWGELFEASRRRGVESARRVSGVSGRVAAHPSAAPYDWRTGGVRALWVAANLVPLHTRGMPQNARATVFVTGAAGFIGTELVNILVTRGYQVVGLTRSHEGARRLRRVGAIPVVGDLLVPGRWQDEAAADWVFHLPPHPLCGTRVIRHQARMTRARVAMDTNLLEAVSEGATRRIVYVADACWYGAVGSRPVTEDESPAPSACSRCLRPALESLDGYVLAGLPIVTAFAGRVYGNGSWYRARVVEPVMGGRRVLRCGKTAPLVSLIHVQDCARALVHLAERGAIGSRYFLVNDDPVRTCEFAETFARLAHRRLRVWRMPAAAAPLLVAPVPADCIRADAVFSNIRLRSLGFTFRYPTLEQGVEQILGALDE